MSIITFGDFSLCLKNLAKIIKKLNQSNILPEDIPECAVVTDRINQSQTKDSNDIQIIVKNKKIPNHYSICWYRLRNGLVMTFDKKF